MSTLSNACHMTVRSSASDWWYCKNIPYLITPQLTYRSKRQAGRILGTPRGHTLSTPYPARTEFFSCFHTAFYFSLHRQNYSRRVHSVLCRVKIEPDWNDLSYHGFLRLNAAVQSLGPGDVRAATTMGMFAMPKVQSPTSQVHNTFLHSSKLIRVLQEKDQMCDMLMTTSSPLFSIADIRCVRFIR
jgi:hypothetical protein